MRRRFLWIGGLVEEQYMDVRVGRFCLELGENKVLGVGGGCPPGTPVHGDAVLMPGLCNAHIHLPDAAIADAGEELSLHELVAQPRGLKYRLLAATGPEKVFSAAAELLSSYRREGVLLLGAYVEPGFLAVTARAAAATSVVLRLFAQPGEKRYSALLQLINSNMWIGLDTPLDLEPWELRRVAQDAYARGLRVAAHVSEDEALAKIGDLRVAVESGVHTAIHLTHASPGEALLAAREGVAPIYCPLANLYFAGAAPPADALLALYDEAAPLALGSDNAAWPPQGMGLLLASAYSVYRVGLGGRSREALARALLYAATVGCGRVLAAEPGWQVRRVPLLGHSLSPTIGLVKRLYFSRLLLVAEPPRVLESSSSSLSASPLTASSSSSSPNTLFAGTGSEG